ncbi:high-affinity branched-chain amino acid transport system permease protein LivH (plasmid) [Antarctobacter heliothermus]|uniref:High-affinity branched-chain amino acid transport system permease protein LivH n=1 Tax=Antarctobacter heliothermus TaxID=74033 RepID=A0A222EBF6_9RHOB|nr:branched-chain amino acid ABC transporter permease [Antarctobacter heliothermus]ASP23513.1 high-affinity branched-chain amino acid transport system permease protein LivH [Antarctobacter heliothermus]
MQTLIQLGATALQIGAVYILFSLGLTLIFGVMRIVNFVHGHIFAVAALTVAYFLPSLVEGGLSAPIAYILASLAGIVAALGLGALIYLFGFRYFQRDLVGSFILSIGLVLLLDGVLLHVFGGAVRGVPEIFPGRVSIAGAQITVQRLFLCAVALVMAATLYWTLSHTKLGKALRAVSYDHEAAMMVGVPYSRIAFLGFMIASLLAAVAGVLLAPVTIVSPVIGTDYLIKGFIAVIIGGLGSVPGAILGSLFVASIETFGSYYLDSSYATLAIFGMVIIVLLFWPKGVLGRG